MRIIVTLLLLLGLTACHAHQGGAVRVDGVGSASWNGGHHHHKHHKGCPPGLAKQGRCY